MTEKFSNMEKIAEICINDFRALRNIEITNMNNLCALIGKNDVGKTSILQGLNYLNNNAKSEPDDFKKMIIDISIKRSNGSRHERSDIGGSIRPLNYYFFNVDKTIHDIDELTISKLITQKSDLTEIEDDINELSEQLEDIKVIYSCVMGLEGYLSKNQIINAIFKSTFNGKFGCDLQKLIVKKKFIYAYIKGHSINNSDRILFDELFCIIDKFEIKKDYFINVPFVNKQIKKRVKRFFHTGDSNEILSVNVDSSESKENIERFETLKNAIKRTYLHGSLEMGISDVFFINYFGFHNNRESLNTLLQNSFLTKNDPQILSAILDNFLAKYTERKKDSIIIDIWKSFLMTFDNSTQIGHKGFGIRRLCYLFNYMVDEYRNFGDSFQPTVFAIDEVENSLHPSLQRELMNVIKKVSEKFQILITTHSPYIVNELNEDNIAILKKDSLGNTIVESPSNLVLKYPSLAQINYIAFDEPSIEYHIELYGHIQNKLNKNVSEVDKWLRDDCSVPATNIWYIVDQKRPSVHLTQDPINRTLPFCVRNNIDHPLNDDASNPRQHTAYENNKVYAEKNKIKESIDILITAIKNHPNDFR